MTKTDFLLLRDKKRNKHMRVVFREMDISHMNLSCTDLSNVIFMDCSICYINFSCAEMDNIQFRRCRIYACNFYGAHLSGSMFKNCILEISNSFLFPACPTEGSFIGWKACCDGKIVKLLIPEDAKRSSATTRKCRASHVKVLEILGNYSFAHSFYDRTIYEEGKEVFADYFEYDRWKECSNGIHFFITREEAEEYARDLV